MTGGWYLLALPLLVVLAGAFIALATERRDDRQRRSSGELDGWVQYGKHRVHADCLVWLRDTGKPHGVCGDCRPVLWGRGVRLWIPKWMVDEFWAWHASEGARLQVDEARLVADVDRLRTEQAALRREGLCRACGGHGGHRDGCEEERQW